MRNARIWCFVAALIAAISSLTAAEHRGVVKFGTQPVPGAIVTAQQGDKKVTVVTDAQGSYLIKDLGEGKAAIKVEMRGFTPAEKEVAVAEPAEFTMTMLPMAEVTAAPVAEVKVAEAPKVEIKRPANVNAPAATNTTSGFQQTQVQASATPVQATEVSSDVAQRANDGLLVNASVNNAASSPFSTLPAFGNNRGPRRWPYNGNIFLTNGSSVFDARPFSLTGQDTYRPPYNRMTAGITLGGPIRIPGLIKNGPQFTLSYTMTRNRNVNTQTGLMPTEALRNGDFSQALDRQGRPIQLIDPTTGLPMAGNQIPLTRISPQAQALMKLYPLPNFAGDAAYNYQVPLINNNHSDSGNFRTQRQIGRKDNVTGTFQWSSTRNDSPNIFNFLSNQRNVNRGVTLNWRHTFNSRFYVSTNYQFQRGTARFIPFWSNRENISGLAGVTGNNQESVNWGAPNLQFTNGITALNDQQYSSSANQTSALNVEAFKALSRHNLTFGGDFRRIQNNQYQQQDARGTFQFTGATVGSDFASFLLGIPDGSSLAFGNADKYFRSNAWDAYVSDDWRFRSGLSLTLGLRWEYNSPVTEKYGRLVNLGIGGFFQNATQLVGGDPIRPDRNNLAPRFGFAWRPLPASSIVIRGGYGVYFDGSQYQQLASQMAQQAPLSRSLRVQNSLQNPLTLANGFVGSPTTTPNTYAVDPYFRVGYAQNWTLSVQRDMPFALQMVATYIGIKGTRGPQQFLPNTFPVGAIDPCPTCPTGFTYLSSNGNSIRNSGALQLRRRLRRGFTAEMTYTYAKAIDNAAMGSSGGQIAQNWLDLRAERARSQFDQRHLISASMQYTTGATSGVGFLTTGWSGRFFREWTFTSQFNYGTGLPLTPTAPNLVAGTGVAATVRANYVGGDPYAGEGGRNLNAAAFAVPLPGQWGNAGRNILTGPSQLTLNASASRTFRWGDRFNADVNVNASNVLNHPVFPSWNSTITSVQFGLPGNANQMRTIQTSLRVRF